MDIERNCILGYLVSTHYREFNKLEMTDSKQMDTDCQNMEKDKCLK